MSEERKMVLEMLKEGKIKADEAVKLLEALGEKAPTRHEVAAPPVHHRPRPPRPSRAPFGFDEVGFDSLRQEIQSVVAEAVRSAKVASKEAIEEAKQSVREAMRESRKTLREAAREIDKARNATLKGPDSDEDELEDQLDQLETEIEEAEIEIEEELNEELEALQEQFEEAEDLFEEAKELMSVAKEMKEDAAGFFRDAEAADNEEEREEYLKEARELEREAESMLANAQALAKEAEEAMLKARRKARERGIAIGKHITKKADSTLSKLAKVNAHPANIGKVIGQVTSQIGPIIANTVKSIGFGDANTVEVKSEMTVQFEDLDQTAEVNASLQNGYIEITTHDDSDTVRVILHKKIRGTNSEERAREIAKNLVQVGVTDNLLRIEGQRKFGGRHVVNIRVSLPTRGKYELNLTTVNGNITCEDLSSTSITAVSTNGNVILRGGSAESIRAATTHGKVIADINCEDIDLNTTKGDISCSLRDAVRGTAELSTVNGNVELYLGSSVKFKLEASTDLGKIQSDLPEIEVTEDQKTTAIKGLGVCRFKARSAGAGGDECVCIRAHTTRGNIEILPLEN